MKLFNNYTAPTYSTPEKGSPEYASFRYSSARHNLLLAIVFTAVNIVLFLTGMNLYFLFSIFLPYSFFGEGLGLTVVAVLLLAVYVLAYFLSKEKKGWLTAALVLFIIDCVCFVGLIVLCVLDGDIGTVRSSLFDLLFHIWVLISLIGGVKFGKKLEEETAQIEAAPYEDSFDE